MYSWIVCTHINSWFPLLPTYFYCREHPTISCYTRIGFAISDNRVHRNRGRSVIWLLGDARVHDRRLENDATTLETFIFEYIIGEYTSTLNFCLQRLSPWQNPLKWHSRGLGPGKLRKIAQNRSRIAFCMAEITRPSSKYSDSKLDPIFPLLQNISIKIN